MSALGDAESLTGPSHGRRRRTTPYLQGMTMGFLTTSTLLKMGLDLVLGVCMKLFCDNGRVHWRDFVNDYLFWVPGVVRQDGDGLSRQVLGLDTSAGDFDAGAQPVAAK